MLKELFGSLKWYDIIVGFISGAVFGYFCMAHTVWYNTMLHGEAYVLTMVDCVIACVFAQMIFVLTLMICCQGRELKDFYKKHKKMGEV